MLAIVRVFCGVVEMWKLWKTSDGAGLHVHSLEHCLSGQRVGADGSTV